jgi:transketolase
MKPIEKLAVDTIRTLSMDGVQAANSGHPGTPMALAPIAYVLYNETMRYDPAQPLWPNRDRFVLSAGHASMLLYSALHLTGVKQVGHDLAVQDQPAVSLDDIRNFRQMDSKCPGHPEYGHTSGVETTSGPLGSGIATSVGMAIASKWYAGRYNKPGYELFDFNAFAVCGDGDLMEGLSGEAASLAGHLKLSNLCWFYDDNEITIEGSTSLAFSEDVQNRFEAYGWNVLRVGDINDLDELRESVKGFMATTDRPTLVIMKTVIGFGSPNKGGTHHAHGAPIGDDEIKLTKKAYGWPEDKKFLVPDGVYEHFQENVGTNGAAASAAWNVLRTAYAGEFPELAAELDLIAKGELPEDWAEKIEMFPADEKGLASRASGGKVLNQLAEGIPWMIGGSADLGPSNLTTLKFDGAGDFSIDTPAGRNFHFGIREHAMAAVANGLALSGLRSFCSTFFVFADYLRPQIRLSALMGTSVMYIFTHDSIGVGEDGPTHQPVEHLASLRAIPNVNVFRPADANEVVASYKTASLTTCTPSVMVLTRQNLPTIDRDDCGCACGTAQGAYVLADAEDAKPDVILIATGSEVSICLEARKVLAEDGLKVRVVSMPCWELFTAQPVQYQEGVLPPSITARVGVEMGVRLGWDQFLGPKGEFIGMEGFGASAPAGTLAKHFGFTVENVVAKAKETLTR